MNKQNICPTSILKIKNKKFKKFVVAHMNILKIADGYSLLLKKLIIYKYYLQLFIH